MALENRHSHCLKLFVANRCGIFILDPYSFALNKFAVLIKCLNFSLGLASNLTWATFAHISTQLRGISNTFLLHTFDTVVALVLSIDQGAFRNLFFCKFLVPVSRSNGRHPETSFCVYQIPSVKRFLHGVGQPFFFACFSLPLLYDSNMTLV